MEPDEEDVLEGDNDNSTVDKDSEIEKLKKDVVDLPVVLKGNELVPTEVLFVPVVIVFND